MSSIEPSPEIIAVNVDGSTFVSAEVTCQNNSISDSTKHHRDTKGVIKIDLATIGGTTNTMPYHDRR